MMRRARLLAVLVTLAAGAVGVISSTQTWLVATLDDGAQHTLAVSGAAAVPVLAPLSLAVLALGAALSIVGLLLRFVFGALTVAIAGVLGFLSVQVAFGAPVTAVALDRHDGDRHHRRGGRRRTGLLDHGDPVARDHDGVLRRAARRRRVHTGHGAQLGQERSAL